MAKKAFITGITGVLEPVLILQDGLEIPLYSVIAVNGIFVPEYSEC